MANHALLNNVDHKDLHIDTQPRARYGDNVSGTLILPQEFMQAHKEYPIFFQKDEQSGQFQSFALLGFEDGENVFLSDSGWDGDYVPALIRREPFLIGFQQQDGDAEKTPVIHIDLDNPRVSTDETGERVFLEGGGNSPYLQEVSKTLMMIHEGMQRMSVMFEAFTELDLIEPFTLDVEFESGAAFKTSRYYTLDQEKLFGLDDAVVAKLHRSGYLQYAYMVLESTSNIRRLIDRKNGTKS